RSRRTQALDRSSTTGPHFRIAGYPSAVWPKFGRELPLAYVRPEWLPAHRHWLHSRATLGCPWEWIRGEGIWKARRAKISRPNPEAPGSRLPNHLPEPSSRELMEAKLHTSESHPLHPE